MPSDLRCKSGHAEESQVRSKRMEETEIKGLGKANVDELYNYIVDRTYAGQLGN